MKTLRKLLSIALLAIFGLSFLSPLLALTAKGDTQLPVCCRRSGKHLCALKDKKDKPALTHAQQQIPAFAAPVERCPFWPASFAMTHSEVLAAPTAQAVFAALVAHPAVFAQIESKLHISRSRSRQKRGPPASSSL